MGSLTLGLGLSQTVSHLLPALNPAPGLTSPWPSLRVMLLHFLFCPTPSSATPPVPFPLSPRETEPNRNICELPLGVSQASASPEGHFVRDMGIFWEIWLFAG